MSDRIIVTYFLIQSDQKIICGSCGRWVTTFDGASVRSATQAKHEIEKHVADCPHLTKMRRDLEPFVVAVEKP